MSSEINDYITESELKKEIKQKEEDGIVISDTEKNVLRLNRRRLSIEMKKEELQPTKAILKTKELIEKYSCVNSYPYKIMIIGDELESGKKELLRQLSNVQSEKHTKSQNELDIFENQIKIFEIEKESGMKQNFCLQLWLPECPSFEKDEEELKENMKHHETVFFNGTDVYFAIFSIKCANSFAKVKTFLESIKEFKEKNENPLEKDIPIFLVGNFAEERTNPDSDIKNLVKSKEAVLLAKQYQVSKYIEINSRNGFHIAELFNQAIGTIENLHDTMETEENNEFSLEKWQIRSLKEDLYYRSILTLNEAKCFFNQLEKSFEIIQEKDVTYFYTLDGTDPSKVNGYLYSDPIKLIKPYPAVIKVIGYRRGYFSNEIQDFEVPDTSSSPDCFFDSFTKGFHILRKPNTTYFVSVKKNEEPGPNSLIYEDPGLFFDHSEKPNSSFSDNFVNSDIPEIIKVVAVEKNKFKSKTKQIKPFPILSSPTVHFSCVNNMLKIDTVPGVVYKYTLDGMTPSYESQTYSGPIMLPNWCKRGDVTIKVGAFPKYYFPSKVVTVITGGNKKKFKNSRSPSPTIQPQTKQNASKSLVKMTKTSFRRSQSPQNLNFSNLTLKKNFDSSMKLDESPRNNSRFSPRSSKNEKNTSPFVRPQKNIKSSITIKEQEAAIHRKKIKSFTNSNSILNKSPKKKNSQQFKVNTSFRDEDDDEKISRVENSFVNQKNDVAVTCKAEGTNVKFEFEKQVMLTKILIKTPGFGKGPSGYECFNVNEEEASVDLIGKGELEDEEGEQVLKIDGEVKCKKLLCEFKMKDGQKSFKIIDMKVEARPF